MGSPFFPASLVWSLLAGLVAYALGAGGVLTWVARRSAPRGLFLRAMGAAGIPLIATMVLALNADRMHASAWGNLGILLTLPLLSIVLAYAWLRLPAARAIGGALCALVVGSIAGMVALRFIR